MTPTRLLDDSRPARPVRVGEQDLDPGVGAALTQQVPDQTVWSGYGAGYGFAPLVLPVAALAVLRRQAARRDAVS